MTVVEPYDDFASGYATSLDPTLEGAAERLAELAGAGSGRRLLDLATGTGTVARAAARRGASVAAVDRSPGMLAVARELSGELELQRADAHALPFGTGAFDSVTCGLSLSHFAHRDEVLREILRVLSPGGLFVASAWRQGGHLPTGGVDDLLDRYGAPGGADVLDEATWQDPEQGSSALQRAGFVDVSVRCESFDGTFAEPAEALAWALGWPLTASRVAKLDLRQRERLHRELLQALAGSSLSWRMSFNFYIAGSPSSG